MRSLEIRTQRIFNNLIKQNQKLASDFVLKQLTIVSGAQSPASKMQRPTSSAQRPPSNVQRRESSVQRPESRVKSPASRVQRRESRVQSPASRVQRPESSVQHMHPESRNSGMPVKLWFKLFLNNPQAIYFRNMLKRSWLEQVPRVTPLLLRQPVCSIHH